MVRAQVILLSPAGDEVQDLAQTGWGLGGQLVLPLPPRVLGVTFGGDFGILEPEDYRGIDPFTNTMTVYTMSQDVLRVFGGIELGSYSTNAAVQPRLGVNVAFLYQKTATRMADPGTGVRQLIWESTDTGFGFDVTAGARFRISKKSGLDVGARYLTGMTITVPKRDGTTNSVRPEYWQFFIGVGIQFDKP